MGRPARQPLRHALTGVLWALAVSLAVAAPLAGADDDEKDGGKEKRATLSLKVRPPVSFSPARVIVTAELRGGSDPELYCPDLEWDWGDDTRSESRQNCDPFVEGESEVTRRFTASHTYTTAGRYRAMLRLKRGDKVLVAGTVRFEVRPGAGDFGDFDR